MLTIRTRLAASPIEGLGVFAAEAVEVGDVVWRFMPGLDLVIPFARVAALPAAFRDHLVRYAYTSPEFPEAGIVLVCDEAKYLNHSSDPNCESRGPVNRALRRIEVGEEITCDYGACVQGWQGFE